MVRGKPFRIVGYHFSSRLTATLNLCLIYFKITRALAILLKHTYKKFDINRTKIEGGCQSERKVVTNNSKSDLPLVSNEAIIVRLLRQKYTLKNQTIFKKCARHYFKLDLHHPRLCNKKHNNKALWNNKEQKVEQSIAKSKQQMQT